MKPHLIILFILITIGANTQTVQWASKVVDFSSEFVDGDGSPRFRAIQILGKPDVFPQGGASGCSWSPKKKKRWGKEYIHVGFERPMQIKQVAIGENFNCGTVIKVELFDDQGERHKIYAYEVPKPGERSRMFRLMMPLTPYKVKEVKVYLKTSSVKGWNLIDCIGISDSDQPIEAKINTIETNEVIQLEKLGDHVNSDYEDLSPMISADGKHLFIVRKNHPENTGDKDNDEIWVCDRISTGWDEARRLPYPLNNKDHNYVNGVSPDGNVLLLGNIYGERENKGKGMSVSYKRNGKWFFPTPLEIEDYHNKSEYMESHMTSNMNVIVMAVWRNETYGEKDLYVTFNQGKHKWSKPMNLGPTVNTARDEIAPFLAADGRTLYYSTYGLSGYGDADIFVTHRLDDTWQNWSEPVNLGPVINSENWDAYLSLDAHGEYAFLSRSIRGSGTQGDIYKIHLIQEMRPEEMQVIGVRVKGMGETVDAFLSYTSVDDPSDSGIAFSNQINGGHVFHFSAHMSGTYKLTIDAPGYKPIERTIDVGMSQSIELQMERE